MQEIKCPNCGQVFQVDESGYAQIVQQVRDSEFEKELLKREAELAEKKESDLKLVRMQQEQLLKDTVSGKDAELAEKTGEIERLRIEKASELDRVNNEKVLEIEKIRSEKDREI